MRKFTHHHITRHDNQVFVGTQNPLPGFESEQFPIQNDPNLDSNSNNISNSNSNSVSLENSYSYISSSNNSNNNNLDLQNETEKSHSTVKKSSSLPMQSNFFNYTVQEGDTLQSISDKFGVRKSLIKKANRIYNDDKVHAGENLQIFTNFDISQKINPIEVYIYDATEQTDGQSGKLSIKQSDLIFTPKSIFTLSHHINLMGYLESDVIPHPSMDISTHSHDKIESIYGNQRYILVVNYLSNPSDKTTSVTEFFTGEKEDLENYRIEIIKVADLIQEKNNYNQPDPNSIYYSQDFSDQIKLPARKRRSNSGKKYERSDSSILPSTQTMRIFLNQIKLLNGRIEIISTTEIFLIRKQLPVRYQNSNWSRLYKNTIDGSFLNTFYRKVAGKKPLLFFLKTQADDLIGAFIPIPLQISDNYYGNGDMFLFNFKIEVPMQDQITSLSQIVPKSDQAAYENQKQEGDQISSENINQSNDQISSENYEHEESSPRSSGHTPRPRTVIKTYRWNSLKNFDNRLFILSNNDSILFGGGDSSALFINKDMCSGYSDPCDTFNSPRLTNKKKFDVSIIEVWQVG